MEQNLAAPLSIKALSGRLGVSARQLERIFHERLGESPQESYMAIRLRHAQWMLANTSLSAAAIAAELGFVDGAHLSRSFKLRLGTTPTDFRSAARAAGDRDGGLEASRPRENEDRRVFK
jgi:transcriptional regulator GlxA family with amidase domain